MRVWCGVVMGDDEVMARSRAHMYVQARFAPAMYVHGSYAASWKAITSRVFFFYMLYSPSFYFCLSFSFILPSSPLFVFGDIRSVLFSTVQTGHYLYI
mmetsp:Transcript_40314/g.104521  ORF Transcript_40314/g.104521 Transcript_40314/m.104521 type:complete len:98 (-) Transcript_40314:341-634(-)